jgi:hypothetical protein
VHLKKQICLNFDLDDWLRAIETPWPKDPFSFFRFKSVGICTKERIRIRLEIALDFY